METKDKNNMSKRTKKHILYRFALISIACLILGLMIATQLFKNTVIDADKWQARTPPISKFKPERGNIYSACGEIIATDDTIYTMRIDYKSDVMNKQYFNNNIDELCDSIAANYPLHNADEWKELFTEPLSRKILPRAHRILDNLSKEECDSIKYYNFNLKKMGIFFDKKIIRVNPYGNLASRTIGVLCDKGCGVEAISGIECYYNDLLTGDLTEQKSYSGYNVYTTLDMNIQSTVHSALDSMLHTCKAEWGTAVVMEVKTGDIVAMANLTIDSVSGNYVECINHAARNFEPGSVFMTIPLTLAIGNGAVSDTALCISTGNNYSFAGGQPITDTHGVASMKISEILERSSNIGLVKVMQNYYNNTPSDFRKHLAQARFLDTLNVAIPGVELPFVPEVKDNREGRIQWSRQILGYNIATSPLSVLAWYNALANDGVYMTPRLVKQLIHINEKDASTTLTIEPQSSQLCSDNTAHTLQSMLYNVVWGQHGTAHIIQDKQVKLAGKTGTSFVYENRHYNTNKKITSFAGYFPADNPRYSCIVVINNPTQYPKESASTSGIVFKQIALQLTK